MREIYEEPRGINWDKKVVVELSLLELQMIKDAFGVSSEGGAVALFNNLTDDECPYEKSSDYIYVEMYKTLKEIVKRNGGVV